MMLIKENTVKLVMYIFASLAGITHVLFFCLESILWSTPKVQKIFNIKPDMVQATKLMAFNQGFYNLFLALGVFVGIGFLARQKTVGMTLIIFGCLCMLGAALVLLFSAPHMMRGVLIQGVPPFIALIAIFCGGLYK